MNRSFYIGALGAQQQQASMNVTSNNIANVNSHGYKAERSRFAGLLYQQLQTADGEPCRRGSGTALWATDTDHRTGAAAPTGRTQDYMIEGSGFFALVQPSTGDVSFTRNGAFSWASLERTTGGVDEKGVPMTELRYYLSDGSGRFVLGRDGGMIELEAADEKQDIGIFDYMNYNGMEHLDGTRFAAVEKNGGLLYGSGRLVQGMLETSNVDLAEEMTKVIEAQRAYSLALKMAAASDEIETAINNLRG